MGTNMADFGNRDCFKNMQIKEMQIELTCTEGRHASYLTRRDKAIIDF